MWKNLTTIKINDMKTNLPKRMYENPVCELIVMDPLSPLCQSSIESFSTEQFEEQKIDGFSF